jgi:hypothetical protein
MPGFRAANASNHCRLEYSWKEKIAEIAEIAEVVQRKREFSKSSAAFSSAISAFKSSVWSNDVFPAVTFRQDFSSESPAMKKLRQRVGVIGV